MKRATGISKDVTNGKVISIHALVKRATDKLPKFRDYHGHFNPRPREEGDEWVKKGPLGVFPISIHALVKRATCEEEAE